MHIEVKTAAHTLPPIKLLIYYSNDRTPNDGDV